MSGPEAIRWKQKYPDEVKAIIGLDMAAPEVYLHWKQEEIDRCIRFMKRMRSLNHHGLLFWYPLSKRGLNKAEIKVFVNQIIYFFERRNKNAARSKLPVV